MLTVNSYRLTVETNDGMRFKFDNSKPETDN